MSDTIKLSELLDNAVGALHSLAVFYNEYGNINGSSAAEQDSKRLAVIAPALVEVVRNSARTCSCAFGCPDCPHCQLEAAMKEAGVTCE